MQQKKEQKVEDVFIKAFNEEDLKIKATLMKDNIVRKQYLKMHKNKILKEYTK